MQIIGLYTGKLSNIGPRNSPTGINKRSVTSVQVDTLGILGDVQADKRFHGGPEKALHQFALSSYEKIIKRYPLLHKIAQPGMIGENITATAMQDDNVCIGDIYQVGSAVVQVSSPRIPCWKIDAKLKQPDLHRFVGNQHITGWYYRVLQGGTMDLQQSFSLQHRPNPTISIQIMMTVINGQSTQDRMEQVIKAEGLDPHWQERLLKNKTK
jgi:MOSC domain-containing protein YiiM